MFNYWVTKPVPAITWLEMSRAQGLSHHKWNCIGVCSRSSLLFFHDWSLLINARQLRVVRDEGKAPRFPGKFYRSNDHHPWIFVSIFSGATLNILFIFFKHIVFTDRSESSISILIGFNSSQKYSHTCFTICTLPSALRINCLPLRWTWPFHWWNWRFDPPEPL